MLWVCIASAVVAGVGADITVRWLRRLVPLPSDPPLALWLARLLGISERAIVISLLIWAPTVTPGFVGGWVALKIAGSWGVFKEGKEPIRRGYQIGLLGNVISIGSAALTGALVSPAARAAFLHP